MSFTVDQLSVTVDGKKYVVTVEPVIDAFDHADYGDFSGAHKRYFMRLGTEMKSIVSILVKLLPVSRQDVDEDLVERIVCLLRTLGFEVLDTRIHQLG